MTIAFFNIDHDIVLEKDTDNFIPSKNVAKMISDLDSLPLWYCEDASIITSNKPDRSIIDIANKLDINNHLIYKGNTGTLDNKSKIVPWGWNKTISKLLRERGFESVPSKSDINFIRELSSRKTNIDLLEKLRKVENTTGDRKFINDIHQLDGNKDFILKSLWSSSGKGLTWNYGKLMPATTIKAIAEIKKHGGFVIEQIISNKVMDFAMEFNIDDNSSCDFIGYSVFTTDDKGLYKMNLIGENKDRILSNYLSDRTSQKIKEIIIDFAENCIASHYKGPFGVDMMVCNEDGKLKIQPCIEINLRMNMGILSLCMSKLTASNSNGYFTITHSRDNKSLKSFIEQMNNKNPLTISQGKIVKGFLPLTPVREDTLHMAYVSIRE